MTPSSRHEEILNVDESGRSESNWPAKDNEIAGWTDKYFVLTKEIVKNFGDAQVTYAVFMRRPVISAPMLAVEWLESIARRRNI